jgi:hypothetical protein
MLPQLLRELSAAVDRLERRANPFRADALGVVTLHCVTKLSDDQIAHATELLRRALQEQGLEVVLGPPTVTQLADADGPTQLAWDLGGTQREPLWDAWRPIVGFLNQGRPEQSLPGLGAGVVAAIQAQPCTDDTVAARERRADFPSCWPGPPP